MTNEELRQKEQYERGKTFEKARVYRMAEIIEIGFKALQDDLDDAIAGGN